ncbi:hypothetical protein AVEN_102598-1 [Araneus ventricosus]|uniref:Uncharacterized protein n=1 Tax=Araneus ventricosus TaxID=182803 RepID=A0A4Y2BJ30_ARAVE|nr:hypothetical protein AVEN_102598-1 [Araneus ventricosus]
MGHVILSHGEMTRETPEPLTLQVSVPHQLEDVRPPTCYLTHATGPHLRWIFSGIGFRTWNPPGPRPRPYQQSTTARFVVVIGETVQEFSGSPAVRMIAIGSLPTRNLPKREKIVFVCVCARVCVLLAVIYPKCAFFWHET